MERAKVDALRRGSHKAFEAVFIAYFQKVKLFIYGIVKSESDAEELTQEIFLKLWINRNSIDAEKPIVAYIYTMARNSAFNFLKHKSVQHTYIKDFKQVNSVEDGETLLFAREISLLIEMSVNEMPPQRRRIYLLSRESGISNADIAIQLGISKKTVENQLSLALKELRKVISLLFLLFS